MHTHAHTLTVILKNLEGDLRKSREKASCVPGDGWTYSLMPTLRVINTCSETSTLRLTHTHNMLKLGVREPLESLQGALAPSEVMLSHSDATLPPSVCWHSEHHGPQSCYMARCLSMRTSMSEMNTIVLASSNRMRHRARTGSRRSSEGVDYHS